MLTQTLTKAVETLVVLLDTGDDRVKRLTANDIINHFLKRRELVELEKRIERIEERLQTQVFEDTRVVGTRELSEEEVREFLQDRVIDCEDAIASLGGRLADVVV